MLEDYGGRRGMTTHKETETAILRLFEGFEVGRRQLGNGKTIFKLGADEGGIDLGT